MLKKLFGLDIYINQTDEQAFNLDTLLLAHFIKVPAKAKKIIDVGTGSGILTFYLNQLSNAKVIGLEVLENRYLQAKNNVSINQLEENIEIIHTDYNNYQDKDLDLIISNPPFFKMNEVKHLSQDEERLVARFEKYLTLEAFIEKSSKILKNGGYLTFIHRPERLFEIIKYLSENGMSVRRMQSVHPTIHDKANHILIEAIKRKNTQTKIEKPIIIYDENKKFNPIMDQVYKGEKPCF